MEDKKSVDGGVVERSAPYEEQVSGVIEKLGNPKPELLWILLLVIVIEGAQMWENAENSDSIRELVGKVIEHVNTVESNRKEENRRMQEVIKELTGTVVRQGGVSRDSNTNREREKGVKRDESV